jgi:Mn2+/Fe2+ NRAMP family transporter
MLWTAVTLHANGPKDIESSRQAAEALRPLAGWFAATLYTVGLVGVGLLAIPTLIGSSAHAFAETFGWRQGLDRSFRAARPFYAIIMVSTLAAIGLDFSDINPVRALFWAAVVNGMLAPFLLGGILLVASDRHLMHNQPSSPLSRVVVAITTLAMFAAAIALCIVWRFTASSSAIA